MKLCQKCQSLGLALSIVLDPMLQWKNWNKCREEAVKITKQMKITATHKLYITGAIHTKSSTNFSCTFQPRMTFHYSYMTMMTYDHVRMLVMSCQEGDRLTRCGELKVTVQVEGLAPCGLIATVVSKPGW